MREPRIVVVGDTITDIIVMPEGPLVRGSDRRARIRSHPGGSAANHAVWLASFGLDVRFVSRVGAGDLASATEYFRARGVTAHFAADPELPSGVLISIIDPDGERSFLTDRGANLNLSAADLAPSLLDGAGQLVVSGYTLFTEGPRTAAMALLRHARERQVPSATDPASVGFLREVDPQNFLRWTEGTGTIFANADEARELTGTADLGAQVQALGRYYDRVVIKRGEAGAAVGGRAGVELSLPAPATSVVDTTGAGDAFAAAFLAADLRGRPLAESLAAGIAAGSRAVTTIGGQPG